MNRTSFIKTLFLIPVGGVSTIIWFSISIAGPVVGSQGPTTGAPVGEYSPLKNQNIPSSNIQYRLHSVPKSAVQSSEADKGYAPLDYTPEVVNRQDNPTKQVPNAPQRGIQTRATLPRQEFGKQRHTYPNYRGGPRYNIAAPYNYMRPPKAPPPGFGGY